VNSAYKIKLTSGLHSAWRNRKKIKINTIKRIQLLSEEDRATAPSNTYGKFREVWTCGFVLDMLGDRQTDRQTDKQTHRHAHGISSQMVPLSLVLFCLVTTCSNYPQRFFLEDQTWTDSRKQYR